ncbi:MAG: DUF2796 domain-containing protein [Pseudomonadota bacterium]
MMRCFVAGLMCLSLATPVFAKDKHNHGHKHKHRQLSAHEHGSGSFNVAIEGKKVAMELEAPGADIVGFEHKARTKKQKAAITKAKDKLKKLSNVVVLSEEAGCKLEKASIELHIEGGDDGHNHGKKKKAKHNHGHKHGHNHGKKKAKKEETHSEFHAEYQLTCESPEKLVEIAFPYFKNFKGAEELEVSVAGPKSQKKFEVERKTGKINLGGVI